MAVAESVPLKGRLRRIVEHPAVKIAIPLLIAVIAVFVLHRLASHVKWVDVKTDLAAAPLASLLKALGFAALGYAGIALYDGLAVRSLARAKVPLRIAALIGSAGYAISGLLGVSYLTGTAVRNRVYSSFRLDLALIAGVLLLVSGNPPAEQSRLGVQRELLPLAAIEASHLAGSIAGILLIVVARGLYRKLYRAWITALTLIAMGLVASLLKGLVWKESLSTLATLRAFKEKFGPEWSPNYLACPGGLAAPRILYEVNVLISGGIRGLTR